MVQKECDYCGEMFEAARITDKYCSREHTASCENCGENFRVTRYDNHRRKTCSRKCANEMKKKTSLKKYGTDNPARSPEVRSRISTTKNNRPREEILDEKEKARVTNLEKYGETHPMRNKQVKAKAKQTSIRKYGVGNPGANKKIRAKIEETNLKKYGAANTFESAPIKEKIRNTNLQKYGYRSVLSSPDVRAKIEETNLQKYGVKNPASSDKVREKIRNTNKERYGAQYIFQSEKIREKIEETNLQKYGVKNPASSDKVKEKIRNTNLQKYGYRSVLSSPAVRAKIEETNLKKYGVSSSSQRFIKNFGDYNNFENFVENNTQTVRELAQHFGVSEGHIRRKIRENKLDEFVRGRNSRSVLEEVFAAEMDSLGAEYIRNDRTILHGGELDFVFPHNNLAVEISSTSTHNSLTVWGGPGRTSTYHRDKFLNAEENGYELITIFDWMSWDKVVEMVKHKLSKPVRRVYARDTEVMSVGRRSLELDTLIRSWHVLGLSKVTGFHSYTVLTHNDEVVGIMLWVNTDDDSVVELKRLCFAPGVSVPGGASRLIKNFVRRNPSVRRVITFSDNDLGLGGVYESLGFSKIVDGKPNLNYYNVRYGWHVKHLSLVRQGANRLLRGFPGYVPAPPNCPHTDKHVDNSCLPSNKDIVLSYGFLPVYDTGYRKWVLHV